MTEEENNIRLRRNLGISQPTYRIKTVADLFKVPQERRAAICSALAAWLDDPNNQKPNLPWFRIEYWIGKELPTFSWTEDGSKPATADLKAVVNIDSTEAVKLIRSALAAVVDQGGVPASVLEAFDNARHAAEAPQRDAETEARCEKAIAVLVHEYGLRVKPMGEGRTWYIAQAKFGSTNTDQMVTTVHPAKFSQILEHLQNWLRHNSANLDTLSTMRRTLRAIPPGWQVQWVADVAGTTVGVWRLFQPVPSHEADHPVHGMALGNSETTEFDALREALGLFIDTKTLASAKLRFGTGLPPFAGFPSTPPRTAANATDPLPPVNADALKPPLVGHDGKTWPGTMDAKCWASAWMAHTTLYPNVANDEGAMLGWFANAIMAGYDTAMKRAAEAAKSEPLDDPAPVKPGDLPRWKCHKVVQAFKIGRIEGDTIYPLNEGECAPVRVTAAVMLRHNFNQDGYFIRYSDGYESFSPAKPFEEGYTRLGNEPTPDKKTPLQQLRDIMAIQATSGNWDYSPYLLGMYNGMEVSLAIMERREPEYRKKPETGFLEDKPGAARQINARKKLPHAAEELAGLAGPGKNASTVPANDPRLAHWMECTKEWNLGPSMFFRVGQPIELAGFDFEKRMATLQIGLQDVTFDYLLDHAKPMDPDKARFIETTTQPPASLITVQQITEIERGGGIAVATGSSLVPLVPETAVMDATNLRAPDGHVPAVEPPADTKGHEAIQALEKANPDAPGLVGKDEPRVHVFLSDLLGQFARYAVAQSPYMHPEGLLAVLDAIKGDVAERFDPVLRWCELNRRDIEAMLNEAIMALPEVSAWNQRKNGNTSEFAFESRYPGHRDPDNDFIDLQALITNVALACTREADRANNTADLVSVKQPPQEPGGTGGLWRYAEGDGKCKYLVLRRDGTVPEWPYFIMGARDLAAIQAVAAYAWYASLLKYPPQFVTDVERLAREMAAYRQEHGAGNPCAQPDRKEFGAIIGLMQAHANGLPVRVVGIAVHPDSEVERAPEP